MDYSYPIINGKEIGRGDLKIARAKKLALAIENHACFFDETLICRRREDGCEIFLVKIDVEIPQYPKNGIQVNEDVVIICSEGDDTFPQVFALREDFTCGLPHTNISTFEHPVSLCLTEQSFPELKHRFNEFEFIDLIHRWLSLTSEDKLHQEDQPLEPFYNSTGYVILPDHYDPKQYTHLNRIGDSILFELNTVPNGEKPFHILPIIADIQVHGHIRRQPRKLDQIGDVIQINSTPFPEYLREVLNSFLREYTAGNDQIQRLKLAFLCCVPVKRNVEDEELSSWRTLFFITDVSILDIGERSGCLTQSEGTIIPIIGKKFEQKVIDDISVEMYSPIDDFNPIASADYNNISKNENEFILIGAGSLGSLVFEQLMRMGFGTWSIIDHDLLLPHNLAKHALGRKAVGYNKAKKVSEWANELHRIKVSTGIPKNFLEIKDEEGLKSKLKEAKAIIDASTSIAVARSLARDYDDEVSTPRISTFLNPSGTDLVVLAEDKRRKFRLDFLEMQYYRCLFQEELLHDHLDFEEGLKIRYNRNSCREITNKINLSDVAQNASICAKTLRKIIESGTPTISIWRINGESSEVRRFTYEPSRWKRQNIAGWKVYIDSWALKKMNDFRTSKLPNETGGVLIGSVDFQRNIIYVCDSLLAPFDSKETGNAFERGIEGLCEKYKSYRKVTDEQFCYLGEWHSHPKEHSTKPSQFDYDLYDYLYQKMSKQGSPVLMGILGDNDLNIVFRH